jgi:hypothetical protein
LGLCLSGTLLILLKGMRSLSDIMGVMQGKGTVRSLYGTLHRRRGGANSPCHVPGCFDLSPVIACDINGYALRTRQGMEAYGAPFTSSKSSF